MPSSLEDRDIVPELLDSLPADNPRAVASRRDLVRVNAVMFQPVITARLLKRHLTRAPRRILEIGAGDGRFMLSVARRLAPRWRNVELVLLDQADLVSQRRRSQFAALGWAVETAVVDVFDWIANRNLGTFDAVTANLFLHHFEDTMVQRLLARMPHLTSLFLATEPRRNSMSLWSTPLLRAIGANDVTLHDSAASVRAGFRGDEISSLWPASSAFSLSERPVGPYTHTFAAASSGGPR